MSMRTISMSHRTAVQIETEEWPIVASGIYDQWDGQHRATASRTWTARVAIRRHADGRKLVYGSYEYDTTVSRERSIIARAGYLLSRYGSAQDYLAKVRRDLVRQVYTQTRGKEIEKADKMVKHIDAAVKACVDKIKHQ